MNAALMKTIPMTFEEVFALLEQWGSEGARRIYARQGAGDKQFGVTLGKLRGFAKRLKINHSLAMPLWATGNADAMILATMIMDPKQLSKQNIERMMGSLTYFKLVDELVDNVVAKTGFADELRGCWINSSEEMMGRAGWKLEISRILDNGRDSTGFDRLLGKIEAEILSAPRRKQECMNRCLVEIGVHFPAWTQKCIQVGERLGRFDMTPVPKGCTSSYAPEWIAAVLKRQKTPKPQQHPRRQQRSDRPIPMRNR